MLVWLLKKLIRLVRHSLVLTSLFYLSLLVAILIYYIFYQWYIPKAKLEKNIEFELKSGAHFYKQIAQQQQYKSADAVVPHHELVANVNLFDRLGDSLHYGQEYSLTLVMDVPESDWNFDLGMFGVTVDVVDSDGRKIVTYKTMGTLVYKSRLLRYLTTVFYFPSYLLGRFEQRQTIALTLRENFIDNAYMPANKIVIRLSEKLQYYTAVLNIEAKFSGLKYYLYRWYYTTSVLICLGITSIVFIIFISSCFDFKSILYGKDANKPFNHLSPYKKLAYPTEFDENDKADFDVNSNFSARSILDVDSAIENDNDSNASKEDEASSFSKNYFLLKGLNKKNFSD